MFFQPIVTYTNYQLMMIWWHFLVDIAIGNISSTNRGPAGAIHRVRHHVMVLLHYVLVLHRWTERGGEIFMSTKKGREGFKWQGGCLGSLNDFLILPRSLWKWSNFTSIFSNGLVQLLQELATCEISWEPKGSRIVSQPSIFQRLCSLVSGSTECPPWNWHFRTWKWMVGSWNTHSLSGFSLFSGGNLLLVLLPFCLAN